jgi:hypothetical protein
VGRVRFGQAGGHFTLRQLARAALASGVLACAPAAFAQLAVKGELLLEENFQRHATYTKEKLPLRAGWEVRVAHGIWQRSAEGVQSTWVTGHSPVLVLEGGFGDVIVELEWRYRAEPDKWAACRVSATNPTLYPRAYALSVWANVDFKSRGRGFLLENDVWSGPITRVSYAKADFASDTWHTLRLESVGNTALASCNGVTIHGTHEKYGMPKTSLWLATGQSPHEIRRLRIYAAQPNPAWPPPAAAKPTSAPAKQD